MRSAAQLRTTGQSQHYVALVDRLPGVIDAPSKPELSTLKLYSTENIEMIRKAKFYSATAKYSCGSEEA